MSVEVKVPELGESVFEVQIVQWLKQPGEAVDKDEELVEIESEKATVNLPAPAAGVLSEVVKKDGEFANVGDVIGYLDGEAQPKQPAKPAESEAKEKPEETAAKRAKPKEKAKQPEPKPAAKTDGRKKKEAPAEAAVKVMPAAQRLLDEHGLSPEDVEATGPGGRLLKEDVLRQVEEDGARPAAEEPEPAAPAEPADEPAAETPLPGREEEIVPMSMIRRHIGRRLLEARNQQALLTTFNEADMSAVMALRKRYRDRFQETHGIKLGFMSFFAKASVEALKRYPEVNAEIRDRNIVYRNYFDIGVAIGGGKGLVVPVLRSVERMSFAEIEKTIADFAQRAEDGSLQPEELEGGTFTISNGGVYGSLLSTPIVNPPQSGILGLHAIQERPVARDGNVVIRPMMYLALTYDHRIVDGREAVGFLRTVKEIIEEPARLFLEV